MASMTMADGSVAALSPVTSRAPALLKTDCLGRVRSTPERRAGILAEFDQSGVSAAQFAKLAGINYSTFAQWVQKHRRKRAAPRRVVRRPVARSVRLVEAVVVPAKGGNDSGAGLILQLPGGVSLELSAPDQVPLAVSFIQALARRC